MDSAEAEWQVLAYVEIGEFGSPNLGARAYDSGAATLNQVLVEIPYLAPYHHMRI
ncbi:MAG: hypothetical protein OXD42_00035 [Rhodospirillaceae bacterium]|nr:hypothetical protein [Rhodospirillaceae bacterium]